MALDEKLIIAAIDEGMDGGQGFYHDEGRSLTETLSGLSTSQANRILPGAGNSVAMQVAHLITTFEAHDQQLNGGDMSGIDWGAAWHMQDVDDATWSELQDTLKTRVRQVQDGIRTADISNNDIASAGMMAATHLAFHAGQILHAAGYAKKDEA